MSELFVLDPSEVSVGRTELDLNTDPIQIGPPGIDWGSAEIAAKMAEQARGSTPVDFTVPNRTITVPLSLNATASTSLAGARALLRAKVALLQREGGHLKRTRPSGDLFADIVNASLTLPEPGFPAHRAQGGVVLTLESIPDFYGAEEVGSVHTETTNPELIFTLTGVKGDYPGRVRILVNETQAKNQQGLIWAFRSRYYDATSTAAQVYRAADLTALDIASAGTVASRSAVSHASLASNWTSVLGTNVGGTTFLTHKGSYRLFAGVYSTAGAAVALRAVWDVGDLVAPSENPPWRIPGASDWYIADLGELHLDAGPISPHRWQGQIQARGDAGGESVAISRLWIVNTDEGMGRLRAPVVAAAASSAASVLRDPFNQAAGALAGKTAPVGGNWSEAGATGAFAVDSAKHYVTRTQQSDATPHFGLGGVTGVGEVSFQVDTAALGTSITQGDGVSQGMVVRYVDTSNYLAAFFTSSYVVGPGEEHGRRQGALSLVKVVAGASTVLYDSGNVVAYGALNYFWTIRLRVGADGTWQLYVVPQGAALGDPVATGSDAVLATGGTLDDGKLGIYDKYTAAEAITRAYDNVVADPAPVTGVASINAVAFASQSLELRTDGAFRLDPTGSGWGPVAEVFGDLPRIPPAGLEGRTCELFLKLSRGDLDGIPDSGVDDLSAQVVYRPSYLFPD